MLPVLGLVALLAVGCSAGSDSSSAGDGGGDTSAAEMAEMAPADGSRGDADAAAESAPGSAADQAARPAQAAEQRSVISTATVSVESDDVAAARFEVQRLVDELRGSISEEQTDGSEGDQRTRLVLRVPSARLDAAVTALEDLGELLSSTRTSEDVSSEVIDVAARIRAQEQSLARVEVLFGRATSIRDVVAIEAQLTRRQADLDSLKQRQAFLADQTTMATVTAHLTSAPDEEPETETEPDEAGFLPGLSDGWSALTAVGTSLATLAGVLLPFAVVLAVLGVPAAWLLRRRRPRPASPPATGQASG